MQRNLDIGLDRLTRELVIMAGYVEQAIDAADWAWRKRVFSKIQEVYWIEKKVNQMHLEVDAQCVQLLALHQPLAQDLRMILAMIKVNSDLERMADLTVNIANNTEYFLKESHRLSLQELSSMADETKLMVRDVFKALVHRDAQSARELIRRDDLIDSYKRKIMDQTIREMQKDVSCLLEGVNIILIAKNLEKLADHATNIAEDIIFIALGEDVRHESVRLSGEKR